MITSFLLVFHIIIGITLTGAILLQKSEGGLGLSGGNQGSLFTARGAANLLTRATAILATIFLSNCILMSFLATNEIKKNNSVLSSEKKNTDINKVINSDTKNSNSAKK